MMLSRSSIFIFLAVCLCITTVQGKRTCKDASDCDTLGTGLECIKNYCDWGICGCTRGTVARYLGSEKLFNCVPLKKIGESCSHNDETGICGADDSFCNNDNECQCDSGKVAMWGGEHCGDPTDVFATEQHTAEDSCTGGPSNVEGTSYDPLQVLDSIPKSCACSAGSYTDLDNTFDATVSYFVGKKFPTCRTAKIGDMCINDNDCGTGMDCSLSTNKCQCKAGYSYHNYEKTTCYNWDSTNVVSLVGDDCSSKFCDASKGLICGDKCETNSTALSRCTCGQNHITSGTSCTPRGVGSACYGDGNCKGFSARGICVDGSCQDGASVLVPGLLLITLSVITSILNRY